MVETGAPETRAREHLRSLTNLLWHAAIFVTVNAGLWVQDILGGGGVDYAYWTTVPWGIGLVMHALAYVSQLKHNPYLDDEHRRDAQTR